MAGILKNLPSRDFSVLRVFVANQRGEVYLSDWIFDDYNSTGIQSH